MKNNKIIYLDSASTTKCKYFSKNYYENWFNSNSNYAIQEQNMLNESRKIIKECLGVKTGRVLFCRSATEAVEWLQKYWNQYINKGNNIFTCSNYEHDSVFNLQCSDYDITNYILHKEDFYLHQYVNQLTGTIFDIESYGKNAKNIGVYFGSDFTAAIGHTKIPNNIDSFCDAVWFSGHKFHAEKGIGAIWISNKLFEKFNGNENSKNEYNLIHGTINVSSAFAMAKAMEYIIKNQNIIVSHYQKLQNYLKIKLNEAKIKNNFICLNNKNTPAINSVVLQNINADTLQNYLSSKKIFIGIGASACSNNNDYRVLENFGLSKNEAESTVRISFCEDNTINDIDCLIDEIIKFKHLFSIQ